MNNVIITGRTTKEVEVRKTKNGKSVAIFALAVKRDKQTTDFINCIAWGNNADFMSKYVWKGARIGIQGSLVNHKYQDSKGNNRVITEIVTRNIEILDKKENSNNQETINADVETIAEDIDELVKQSVLDIPELPVDTDDFPFDFSI